MDEWDSEKANYIEKHLFKINLEAKCLNYTSSHSPDKWEAGKVFHVGGRRTFALATPSLNRSLVGLAPLPVPVSHFHVWLGAPPISTAGSKCLCSFSSPTPAHATFVNKEKPDKDMMNSQIFSFLLLSSNGFHQQVFLSPDLYMSIWLYVYMYFSMS